VFFLSARQSSGYSSSSSSSSYSNGDDGNSYSYQYGPNDPEYSYQSGYGQQGTSNNNNNQGTSYSYTTSLDNNQNNNQVYSFSGNPDQSRSSSTSYGSSGSSNYGPNSNTANGDSNYASTSNSNIGSGSRWKQNTITPGGDEDCPLEFITRGFQEIARTDVQVPIVVKKPVVIYIEEEECKNVTVPTFKKEFNMFRVAPITMVQTENHSNGYYQQSEKCDYCADSEYVFTADEPYTRYSDSPYLEGGYASSNVDYGFGY